MGKHAKYDVPYSVTLPAVAASFGLGKTLTRDLPDDLSGQTVELIANEVEVYTSLALQGVLIDLILHRRAKDVFLQGGGKLLKDTFTEEMGKLSR